MPRQQIKNANLHHYGVYLDETLPIDKRLIDYLEPLARSRRIGELMRHLLTQHISGVTVIRAPQAEVVRAGGVAAPTIPIQIATIPQLPTQLGSTASAKESIRRAMFK